MTIEHIVAIAAAIILMYCISIGYVKLYIKRVVSDKTKRIQYQRKYKLTNLLNKIFTPLFLCIGCLALFITDNPFNGGWIKAGTFIFVVIMVILNIVLSFIYLSELRAALKEIKKDAN